MEVPGYAVLQQARHGFVQALSEACGDQPSTRLVPAEEEVVRKWEWMAVFAVLAAIAYFSASALLSLQRRHQLLEEHQQLLEQIQQALQESQTAINRAELLEELHPIPAKYTRPPMSKTPEEEKSEKRNMIGRIYTAEAQYLKDSGWTPYVQGPGRVRWKKPSTAKDDTFYTHEEAVRLQKFVDGELWSAP